MNSANPLLQFHGGEKQVQTKHFHFLLMSQCEVLEIIFPCMTGVWGSARSRAHAKTLLLLAEASSSSASWSLNPANSSDLNVLKCLPGYLLAPLSPGGPCGFLRAQHRSQQVNKKKSSEEEMQMRIHFARSLSTSRLNYNWATPILAQSVCP